MQKPVKNKRWGTRAIIAGATGVIAVAAFAAPKNDANRLTGLRPSLTRIELTNVYAQARVLVEGQFASGAIKDVSAQATFVSSDPKIAAITETGIVQAKSPGQTIITATVTAADGVIRRVSIPVAIGGSAPVPRFKTDIMPVLTKMGCNAGACHGANAGKGGFHLSLLGYDPDNDYEALTRFVGARRISPAMPDNSLILNKATARMRHGGGVRFAPDSPEYRALRDWIAGGAPAPTASEPPVSRLIVTPPMRSLSLGEKQRYCVEAIYADNTRRDVTASTLFTSGDGAILEVQKDGTAKVVGPGEGAVVIRYGGVFTIARITAPFGPAKPVAPAASEIDKRINQKIAALGLVPSPVADDSEFIRRATLDVTGVLPKADAVRAFLSDRTPGKRAKLADALLASPEYVDYWTMKWGDTLRSSKNCMGEEGRKSFHQWIKKSVAENKPYDQFVRELILSSGSNVENGAANFYRAGVEVDTIPVARPEDLGESTAQIMLGVRMACARCHNHPFEKWTQNQFYELAAFYGRIEGKGGKGKDETIITTNDSAEVNHPKSGKAMTPTPLDAKPLDKDFKGDRRLALVDWMTARDNPFFAPLIANRLWKHYMGRGVVEPVDDFRVTNPATNEPLLTYLAAKVKTNKFDLKALMREIMLSDAYQRTSRQIPGNEQDTRYFSRFVVKRLTAEQLLDALNDVTGSKEKFDGYPEGTRAMQLMDSTVPSSFLDAFGRPPRITTCECERSNESNLTQALLLLNNPIVQEKIVSSTGRATKLVRDNAPSEKIVEELYLSALSRFPTASETQKSVAWINAGKSREQAVQDLQWAIVNSKEFVFNR